MTDTYITRARTALLAALGDTEGWPLTVREQRLLDLYTLLVLTKGTECSTEDVHDAWAVARQRERPEHPALVPFSLLDDSAAKRDIPYRDAIRSAARRLAGPGARPMREAWVRSLVQQCQAARVPVFVKQMGSVWAGHGKGGDMDAWPADLRVREFPGVPS